LNGKGFLQFKNNFILECEFINNNIREQNKMNLIDLNKGEEHSVVGFNSETKECICERFTFILDFKNGLLIVK